VASKSAQQRSLVSAIGAHALHSQYDSRELTKNARAKFLERFLDEVDPDRVLPEAERQRRAGHMLQAHMKRLALASSKARARKAATRKAAR
jgi:hypothetical protein